MTRKHGILWLNRPGSKGWTWNPVVGCSPLTPGCTNCYAMKMAHRIQAMQPGSHYAGTTKMVNGKPVWTGKVAVASEKTLLEPLHWAKRRMVFVNSMGDLFHPDVPDHWRDQVLAVIALSNVQRRAAGKPLHVFLILTKRAAEMRHYFCTRGGFGLGVNNELVFLSRKTQDRKAVCDAMNAAWPLPNLWLGVSAENQEQADARIPVLLNTPAAVRFVSVEPMLEPVDLRPCWLEKMTICGACESAKNNTPINCPCADPALDWVICGGESGADRRPFDPAWASRMRDDCAAAGVPFFFKQHGHRRDGDDLLFGERHHNWPEAGA